MKQNVIIVGCGWLGQQVAPVLAAAGFEVYGTRRDPKVAETLAAPLQGIALPLINSDVGSDLLALFKDAWVICMVPPGNRGTTISSEGYLTTLGYLAELSRKASIRGGIHISSTGIYQGRYGGVDEHTEPDTSIARVKLLLEGEQILQQTGAWLSLRLAGLMGPGRHPGRFAQGKQLSGASDPVNMVHSCDVARALAALVASWPLRTRVFNLCAPFNLTKTVFYQRAYASLGISDLPQFSDLPGAPGRQVIASAITEATGFHYAFSDAQAALAAC